MDNLEKLELEKKYIAKQIKLEREKINNLLKELIKKRANLNNAIQRAKNYKKYKI